MKFILKKITLCLGEISGFMSTINFFSDLLKISDEVVSLSKKERNLALKDKLRKLNENLPSAVYVPFFKS